MDALLALDSSRAALRREMVPFANDPGRTQGSASLGALPQRARAWWRHWQRQLGRWPVAALAMGAVRDWWRLHPWRPVGELVASEWHHSGLPLLRRYPLTSVTAACALGAVLAVGRPWRWPMVAAQIRPVPRRAAYWLLLQLRQPPIQTALVGLLLMLAKTAAPTDSPRQRSPTAGSDAGR